MDKAEQPPVPLECRYALAKTDITNLINATGEKYDIPGFLLLNLVKEVYLESQLSVQQNSINEMARAQYDQ